MNGIDHPKCFGAMFPGPIPAGGHQGKVFSLRNDGPIGMARSRPNVEVDVAKWDECQQCPVFESCYRLGLAKLTLENTVASMY